MRLEWIHGQVRAVCPVCSDGGAKDAMLRMEHVLEDREPVSLLHCAACGAAFLDDLTTPHYESDMPELLDYYVEQGAGIDLIVAPLLRIPAGSVRRAIEIGCAFGFALDFARQTFHWQVLGVDPSPLAQAGAEALGFPVLHTYFDAALDVGPEPFDLALCSEILEHVADPLPLLSAIRMRLSPEGLLVLSTPNVAIVRPETDFGSLGRALSPGLHLILYDRHSLTRVLEQAGFAAIRIEESPETLRAFASPSPEGLATLQPPQPDRERSLLRSYFATRAATAPTASALACGFAYRHFKECVNAGLYAEALESRERLAHIYRERFALDLEHVPAELPEEPFPFNLAATLFFSAILDLNLGHADRAARDFAAAIEAGAAMQDGHGPFGLCDGETQGAIEQSHAHLPMALAATDPSAALRALHALADSPEMLAPARVQTFIRLVNAGAWEAADELAPLVEPQVDSDSLMTTGERSPGALDLPYCLGMLALHRSRPEDAARWFRVVQNAGAVYAAPGRGELLANARAHEALAAGAR
ncbi:MAG: class I SAM-dependent methyltransferase [Acidobacteria bacterium]|nr:class I SAM-dependent methyltransferase [Acidobacteriota bacterium]